MRQMSPSDDDALHEALWIALMCRCERCGTICDMDDIEHLIDGNSWQWANEAVRRARSLGWTSPQFNGIRSGELLCPTCSVTR